MDKLRTTFTTLGALALCAVLVAPGAALGGHDDDRDRDRHSDRSKQRKRGEVKRMVERALPRWDRRVFDVPDGKRWVEQVSFDQVLAALGEEPAPQDLPAEALRFRDEKRTVRLDPASGKLRYVSRERAWSFERHAQKPAFDERGSLRRVLETLNSLEAPMEEAGAPRVETQMAAGARAGAPRTTDSFEMYRLVLFSRQVGKLPVYGSQIRAALSHDGQVQRLQVSWPAFSLAARLRPRPRRLVVDEAVQQILDQDPGRDTRLRASLVYAPQPDEKLVLRYVPSVLIAVHSLPTPYLVLVPIADTNPDDEP